MPHYRRLSYWLLALMVFAGCVSIASPSVATSESFVCNTDPQLQCEADDGLCTGDDGMLSQLVEAIRTTLDDTWQTMYDSVVAGFFGAVGALAMLYIIISGVIFAIGMSPLSLAEVVKRSLKVAIVAAICGSSALFAEYVMPLLRGGADEIIAAMTTEMVTVFDDGSFAMTEIGDAGANPFTPIDVLLARLFSASTVQIFEASLNTNGIWGGAFTGLFVIGVLFVFAALARAIWVYLMSLLALTLLYGLAPIFIAFLLFERTKNLFNGWLGQVVNYTLQPVLMFTFIGFFVILMIESMDEILSTEVCFGEVEATLIGDEGNEREMVFSDGNGNPLRVVWDISGPKCIQPGTNLVGPCPGLDAYPLDPLNVITFIMLGFVAYSFYDHVRSMAQDISGSFVDLEAGSPINSAVNQIGTMPSKAMTAAMEGGGMNGVMQAVGLQRRT